MRHRRRLPFPSLPSMSTDIARHGWKWLPERESVQDDSDPDEAGKGAVQGAGGRAGRPPREGRFTTLSHVSTPTRGAPKVGSPATGPTGSRVGSAATRTPLLRLMTRFLA